VRINTTKGDAMDNREFALLTAKAVLDGNKGYALEACQTVIRRADSGQWEWGDSRLIYKNLIAAVLEDDWNEAAIQAIRFVDQCAIEDRAACWQGLSKDHREAAPMLPLGLVSGSGEHDGAGRLRVGVVCLVAKTGEADALRFVGQFSSAHQLPRRWGAQCLAHHEFGGCR